MGGYAPLEVEVGQGRVIPGWDEGLGLLKKGDKAKFFIPSTLAYGERGAGGMIKPNSILIFDVEITDVQK
jgi:FKBP-type peptidyl-prolyl cis-trans isomerase